MQPTRRPGSGPAHTPGQTFAQGRSPVAGSARLGVEALEARDVPSVSVRFDYSFDTTGYFNDPARRAAVDQAAAQITSRLQDSLAAIVPSGGNSWQAQFFNPATRSTVTLNNPTVNQDELVVYIGAAPLGGSELGLTTSGGYTATGSRGWLDAVKGRGQAGALTNPKTDFATWGGMITFDSSANWNFSNASPAAGQYDFGSVALHEMMHVFGFGLGEPAFTRHVVNNVFAGPTVVAVNGGSGVATRQAADTHPGLCELGRIHVDEVHHEMLRHPHRHIMRHLTRKGDDRADPPAGQVAANGSMEDRQREQRDRCGQARRQRARDRQPLRRGADRGGDAGGDALDDGKVNAVGGAVHRSDDVHRAQRRQRLEQMPRPDTVTAIGRIGKPVREEQDVGSAHPSPRAISGPMRLAIGSGSRCQARTCRLYFGSSGLTLRRAWPGATREA